MKLTLSGASLRLVFLLALTFAWAALIGIAPAHAHVKGSGSGSGSKPDGKKDDEDHPGVPGKVTCYPGDAANIAVFPMNQAGFAYAGIRNNQLVVGPPSQQLTQGTSAAILNCVSDYMQSTYDTGHGFFQVGPDKRCITVSGADVTLEACADADGPDVAKQFFELKHRKGADGDELPVLSLIGGPPGQETQTGFKIDDGDPEGLLVAVPGGEGDVTLALAK